jgi:alcohol dehydrogenase (NADP+)
MTGASRRLTKSWRVLSFAIGGGRGYKARTRRVLLTIAHGYAAQTKGSPLAHFTFERRDLRAGDVRIEILYCGVCHTDLHIARGEWGGEIFPTGTIYPCVPGHEIVGRIAEVGKDVTKLKPGDLVGVGTIVDSCRECEACTTGLEPYCERGATWTYNSLDRVSGENTYGGYSNQIVARQEFVLRVSHPERDLAAVAPLLCAGITMWSPLRHWNGGRGRKVGIVGVGGLGHVGIKLARALGAHVVAFTSSASKIEDALRLGADEVVVSRNAAEMAKQKGRLDLIVNTVAVSHDLDAYLTLLARDGTMALVGIPSQPHPSPSVATLIAMRRSLAGSAVGGIRETQEMLDFCAEHEVRAEIETIPMDQIETAFARMQKNDVKYRFVVDMSSLSGRLAPRS